MIVENDAEYWLQYMKRVEGVADWLKVEDIVTNKYNKVIG